MNRTISYLGLSVALAAILQGCGGAGAGGSGAAGTSTGGSGGIISQTGNSASALASTFQVDVNTGKVSVVSVNPPVGASRARPGMFTGNSIGFNSTTLTSITTTDTGAKVMSVALVNNSGTSIGQDSTGNGTGINVIFGAFANTTGINDQRPNTTVSTFAGSGEGFADGATNLARFHSPTGVAFGADGSIYVADSANNRVRRINSGLVTTLAGSGVASEADGPGSKASFNAPYSIAVNPVDGSLIVADFSGDKIRRVTTSGVVNTVAGTGAVGGTNGAGNVATFTSPGGVTVDSSGNIYVSEGVENRIRKITLTGNPSASANYTVSTFAGNGTGGHVDGIGASAEFYRPYGLTTDPSNNLYVADDDNEAIRKIDPSGNVFTIAGTGTQSDLDGFGNAATFNHPLGITYLNGSLFVSEATGERVREVIPVAGGGGGSAVGWAVETLAGSGSDGSANGTGSTASFGGPYAIAASPTSSLYVADLGNSQIRRVNPSTGTFPIGTVTGSTNTSDPVELSNPTGVVADSDLGQAPFINYPGTLAPGQTSVAVPWNFVVPVGVTSFQFQVIVEASTSELLELPAATGAGSPSVDVRTFAGDSTEIGQVDGNSSEARFSSGPHIALDSSGIAYVSDEGNASVRRVDQQGNVTTIAGTAASGQGYQDGTGDVAKFAEPEGIVVNSEGTEIFVADTGNQVVRRIAFTGSDPTNPSSWTVTTIAGTHAVVGFANGTGNSATLNSPAGIALSPGGQLYVSEYEGNRIRRLSFQGNDRSQAADWYVQCVAGDDSQVDGAQGNSNNTQGYLVTFASPGGIGCDRYGNLYIVEQTNDDVRVMDPSGSTTTLAGGGGGYQDGQGSSAKFDQPLGLTVDGAGYIYVADTDNNMIRRISPTGLVETVAGQQAIGTADGPGNVAQFAEPIGLAVNPSGTLYVGSGAALRIIQTVINSAAGKEKAK